MPSQTGSIDLASQVRARNNAISVASDDATSKANAAAKTATNYITADSNGIKIHMTNNSTTYQHQTASGTTFYVNSLKRSEVSGDGLKVYVGDTAGSETLVGYFGTYARIGDINSSHTTISSNANAGIAMYNGSTRFLRTSNRGLFIGSSDTAHFSDNGFALYPVGNRIPGDVVKFNAGSCNLADEGTDVVLKYVIDANDTLSELTATGLKTIYSIYVDQIELTIGTDYVQTASTSPYGIDSEYVSTYDQHYDSSKLLFTPSLSGPATVIINCSVRVPNEYYMRLGPKWYNHLIVDEDGFRVVDPKGDSTFNIATQPDNTPLLTIGDKESGDSSYVEIDYKTLKLIDRDGNQFFEVGDQRDITGNITYTDTVYHDPENEVFPLALPWYDFPFVVTGFTVTLDDGTDDSSNWTAETNIDGTATTITRNGGWEDLAGNVTYYAYRTLYSGELSPYSLTFGKRVGYKAPYSTAIGIDAEASGTGSLSIGYDSMAKGYYSTALGQGVRAITQDQTVIGIYNEIEDTESLYITYTITSTGIGYYDVPIPKGLYHASHAGVYVDGVLQSVTRYTFTTTGRYDRQIQFYYGFIPSSGSTIEIKDRYTTHPSKYPGFGKHAFIIGNGFQTGSTTTHSNALTVDWNGAIAVYPPDVLLSSDSAPEKTIESTLLECVDPSGTSRSTIDFVSASDDRQGLRLRTQRIVNGSTVSNHLYLSIDDSGNRLFSCASPTAVRNGLGASNGVWPASAGGTGQTSLQATRNAMGLGDTTGVLPVANGGTGLSASPSMLTNLGSTTAANVLAESPRPGITGTLGAANGGTGSTGYGTLLSNDISESVSVASSTWKSIGSVSLVAGTWLLVFGGYFAAATKGLMKMAISSETSAPVAADVRQRGVSIDTTSSTETSNTKPMRGATILVPTSTTTFRLYVWQNSGSARNCVGHIRAFRLK